eukprot:PhM_4_TR18007/c0_g1_i9/m.89106
MCAITRTRISSWGATLTRTILTPVNLYDTTHLPRSVRQLEPPAPSPHNLRRTYLRYIRIVNPGERPFDVHKAVWNARSGETRRKHALWLVRMKSLPHHMMSWPLPKAAVEIVLMHAQAKNWAWSTIASNLSMIASALENLAMYGNTSTNYKIRDDPYFRAASEKTQKNARIAAVKPFNSEALSVENFISIGCKLRAQQAAWVLLHLCWHFAARLGDMRRVDPREVHIDFSDAADTKTVPIFATFTEGKGAHFWGPYTIHTRIPVDVANTLQEHIRGRIAARQKHCFTAQDQEVVAKEVRQLPGHTARAIRKGALNFLASCGVSNSDLQLVSGHKREDTLKRYLHWGQNDADARQAALHRTRLAEKYMSTVEGAGLDPYTRHPRWMGISSAHHGDQIGRRTRPPPKLFEHKPPSREDLGLVDVAPPSDSRAFHAVKNLSCVDMAKLSSITVDGSLRNEITKAQEWMVKDTHYGIGHMPVLCKKQVPFFASQLCKFDCYSRQTRSSRGQMRP